MTRYSTQPFYTDIGLTNSGSKLYFHNAERQVQEQLFLVSFWYDSVAHIRYPMIM